MVAAICLVGINTIFSGGDCPQAVLQNWSVPVSSTVGGPAGPLGSVLGRAGHDGVDQCWGGAQQSRCSLPPRPHNDDCDGCSGRRHAGVEAGVGALLFIISGPTPRRGGHPGRGGSRSTTPYLVGLLPGKAVHTCSFRSLWKERFLLRGFTFPFKALKPFFGNSPFW